MQTYQSPYTTHSQQTSHQFYYKELFSRHLHIAPATLREMVTQHH